MKKNNFIPLPPFKGWVLQNFPFIEEDFDAITSYQLWCKVVAYLNNTNNNVNVLAKEVLDLKNYIDNLDIQEYVDNKLDEMAESGQLTDIIAQYLQLAGILAYNNLNDMKNAENLANGSFARIMGKNTYNDGRGAFYKIREILNTDVIDNDNIVALTNFNTLIAEKLPNSRRKNMLLIGDSWSMPNYPYVTSQDNCWYNKVANYLDVNVLNYAVSGAGYSITNNSIISQVNNAISNITDPSIIDYIFIEGGYNDLRAGLSISVENYINAVKNCITTLKETFTNAKIFVMGCNTPYKILKSELGNINYVHNSFFFTEMINSACIDTNVNFINMLPFLLGAKDNLNETLHPNDSGMNLIAYSVINILAGRYSKQPLINEEAIYTAEATSTSFPELINDKVINHTDYIEVNFTFTLPVALGSNQVYAYYVDELPLNYMLGKTESNNNSTAICNVYFTTYNYRNLIQIHVPAGAVGKFDIPIKVPIN